MQRAAMHRSGGVGGVVFGGRWSGPQGFCWMLASPPLEPESCGLPAPRGNRPLLSLCT